MRITDSDFSELRDRVNEYSNGIFQCTILLIKAVFAIFFLFLKRFKLLRYSVFSLPDCIVYA